MSSTTDDIKKWNDYRTTLIDMMKMYEKYKDGKVKPTKVTVSKIDTQICTLYRALGFVSPTHSRAKSLFTLPEKKPDCQICFDENVPLVKFMNCEHAVSCFGCFHQYVSKRIEGDDLMPWIPCPHDKCRIPIHYLDLVDTQVSGLGYLHKLQFAIRHMRKHLLRCPEFVPCTGACAAGFMHAGKDITVSCVICKMKQLIKKPGEEKLDPEFEKMLKEGKYLKKSACCGLLTMKEKGVCNVILCSNCGKAWNFKTMEIGDSIAQVKQKARDNGTLWMEGELEYQAKLQQKNLPEFIKLLERNGIKYDPYYKRGT